MPRLKIVHGFWAIEWPQYPRPTFTSFRASVPMQKVLKAVRRDFPNDDIQAPESMGYLFDVEELNQYELSASPLFAEVL